RCAYAYVLPGYLNERDYHFSDLSLSALRQPALAFPGLLAERPGPQTGQRAGDVVDLGFQFVTQYPDPFFQS
ncbi:MAG: hypothetical protein QME74_08830, partial [Candidatus Edwardsbacteria bacterium]|nr:hypothetical protein [Candidatus Edwardsbacteria bacterium]